MALLQTSVPASEEARSISFPARSRKLHIRFFLLPFPPETRFAELSGGSPRGGSGRRRRPGVPGVGAQKSRDGNAVTAFLASAQLPGRLSFPHFFVRTKKWGRRRHLPPFAQGRLWDASANLTSRLRGNPMGRSPSWSLGWGFQGEGEFETPSPWRVSLRTFFAHAKKV